MLVVSFCFFPHSNWKNNCFLFLVAIPAASQSTELLSVGSCLVQGVLFPGGVGITDGGCVCSCCLMLTALRVFKSPVFLLVQGGRSLFRGCCSAWNLHGSAGRAVTSSGFGYATDQTPKCTLTSPALFWIGDSFWEVWGSITFPCPWTELTDPPFWELLVTVSTTVCAEPAFEEQCVPVTTATRKRFLFSSLPFIFYFNISWKFSCKLEFTGVIWAAELIGNGI